MKLLNRDSYYFKESMKEKIQAFIYFLSIGNPAIFGIILTGGLFVTLMRLLAPFQIEWDQSIQLEAAHRLFEGLGLTIATIPKPDIIQPPDSQYLTHFPPALSLVIAFLLFCKIPLVIALKLLYSTITIIGWFFWAIIGSQLLSKPLKLRLQSIPVHYVIALVLPVFYTPSWNNHATDIFLWSGIPIFILLLLNSSNKNSKILLLILSGLLFGLLFSFRYASSFLAITAFLILLQINLPKPILFSKKYLIFFSSSCFITVPTLIFNKLAIGNSSGLPTQVTESRGLGFFEGINEIFRTLSMTSVLSGFTPTSFIEYLQSHAPLINYIYGLSCFSAIVLLPFVVIKIKKLDVTTIRKDITVSLSLLSISLLIFLFAAVFPLSYSPINIARYYLPLGFCNILIVYQLATLVSSEGKLVYIDEHKRKQLIYKSSFAFHSLKRLILNLFIILFLSYNLFHRPTSYLLKSTSTFVDVFLGIRSVPQLNYPSNQLITPYDNSLRVMQELERQYADSLFFIDVFPYFTYNNTLNYRRIPPADFWQSAYISKDVRVFWVIANTNCPQICSSEQQPGTARSNKPIDALASLPNLKTVFIDSFNQTKIMASDLPNGYRFSRYSNPDGMGEPNNASRN